MKDFLLDCFVFSLVGLSILGMLNLMINGA